MKEKITNWIKNLYHRMLAAFREWNEWQEAKFWAYGVHPGWLHLATKAKTEETRSKYREKILVAYRGDTQNTNTERCASCGRVIPEGWQYCDTCWEDANCE